ncbi:hypothetical protein ACO2JO_18440 [Leptospira interrogans]
MALSELWLKATGRLVARMNEVDKDKLYETIATLRGETLAASVLTAATLRAVLSVSRNPQEVLEAISGYVDSTLNISGPNKGDSEDKLNTLMRETARFQAQQHLDGIAAMLRMRPKGNR